MDTVFKIVVLIAGALLSILWLVLMMMSNGMYDEQINDIDSKEYFLPELFQIGFVVIEKLNLNLNTDFFKKKKGKLAEVYGMDNAEFYLYVNVAGQISYVLTLLPIGFMFSLMANSMEIVFITVIAVAVLVYYFDYSTVNHVDERHDELLRDLSAVLSKLVLLVNAGMILKDAWTKVAYTGDRLLYQEMKIVVEDMENGISLRESFHEFGLRCNVKEINKFVAVLEQNQEKGSGELAKSLRELSDESWNEKKQRTIQQGTLADTKLLIPTGIIFMGILLVIIIPLFINMF